MSFLYGGYLVLLLPLFAYLLKRKVKQGFVQNLRWAVLALLIVALARPVLPQRVSQEKVMAHSLVIALDLSASMNATDIEPTRLKASKTTVKAFLEANEHEQVALIGFTINPLLLSPPTTDHTLLKIALENINSEYILTKGTDLKKLFEKVAKFKDEVKKVILFSDGGDESMDESLITFLQEEQIEVFAIGMASKQGESIEQKDGTLLKDKRGNIVVSKLNASLEILAKQSGGAFMLFESVEQTVHSLSAWLSSQEMLNKESRAYFDLSFVPISLALILFFVSATRFSKKLLALFLLLGLNVEAEELISKEHWGEGSRHLKVEQASWGFLDAYYLKRAYDYYDNKAYLLSQKELYKMQGGGLESTLLLAHIFYKQENYKLAKSVLKGIKSSDKKVKQQIYYELGNCEEKMAYRSKAKAYYVKALQLGEDEDSLHNLKIVLQIGAEDASTVGYTNPSSAQKSNAQSDSKSLELEEQKSSASKNEATGATSGSGVKQSKNSTVKVVKSNEEEHLSKRSFSSKAYDLINEGYISEEKPW